MGDAMEADINEQAIAASSMNGHVESGLIAVRKDIARLRGYTNVKVESIGKADADVRSQLQTAQKDAKETQGNVEALRAELSAELRRVELLCASALAEKPRHTKHTHADSNAHAQLSD